MPISRDARMDRRRRVLRDTVEEETQPAAAARRANRKAAEAAASDGLGTKRKAGYSQDVRKACGQRLVQLIPVRRRSFAVACLVSLLIPGLLLALHYWIHVTGQLPWWRHPLAVALDVGHPRSIAAWLSSQLWLLCLGATVLTFQLRRHKLDDYNGEYRLWFWLVLTCLVASVDATTSITQLFAQALDRWTQANVGWSGPAVVDSTLAVLVGMLGLRMCTELKAVPLSLVLWLVALVAWSGSAALARPELQLEMSAPVRYWLISALWMGGLTFVWLSALTYLRHIYIEAQQRFLLRNHLATTGIPLKQRLRESLPAMPRLRRGQREETTEADAEPGIGPRWRMPRLPSFPRRGDSELTAGGVSGGASSQRPGKTAGRRAAQAAATVGASDNVGHGDPATAAPASPTRTAAAVAPEASAATGSRRNKPAQPAIGSGNENNPKQRRGLGGWLRRPKDNGEAEEYRKVTDSGESGDRSAGTSSAGASSERRAQRAEAKATSRAQAAQAKQERLAERAQAKEDRRAAKRPAGGGGSSEAVGEGTPRRWMPKLPRPKLPKLARPKLPKVSKPKLGGWLSRLKLPSIGLSALRLQPPEEGEERQPAAAAAQKMRPVNATRPLPGTHQSGTNLPGTKSSHVDNYDDDDDDHDGRPLSKAERKRLRREQQQGRRAA